jgi:methylglutaconyl-CoA hydratase
MASLIETQLNLPIATVMLTRPELHNAFNAAMIAKLTETFTQLGHHPDVRVIVLSAEGKSFCAGADLNWMQSMLAWTFDENVADARHLADMLRTIDECPKPVIGRIHGAAFGGGVGLTSVCDMVVAKDTATFALTEVKLGLLPAVISPFVLQKIGGSTARRYFLTGERFSAHEALGMGLIHAVVATDTELDETVSTWAKALIANAPEAVSLCKTLIRDVSATPNRDVQITLMTHRIADRRISPEGQEGMRSFLDKRPPAWCVPSATSTSGLHVS